MYNEEKKTIQEMYVCVPIEDGNLLYKFTNFIGTYKYTDMSYTHSEDKKNRPE